MDIVYIYYRFIIIHKYFLCGEEIISNCTKILRSLYVFATFYAGTQDHYQEEKRFLIERLRCYMQQ